MIAETFEHKISANKAQNWSATLACKISDKPAEIANNAFEIYHMTRVRINMILRIRLLAFKKA